MGFSALVSRMDMASLVLLGEPVIYAPGTGSPVTVEGIFDESYVHVDVGNAGVSSVGPAVFLRLANLNSDPRTDDPTLTIRGTAYQIREVKPDGLGGVLISLHLVA